jgi:hypothetical protein
VCRAISQEGQSSQPQPAGEGCCRRRRDERDGARGCPLATSAAGESATAPEKKSPVRARNPLLAVVSVCERLVGFECGRVFVR